MGNDEYIGSKIAKILNSEPDEKEESLFRQIMKRSDEPDEKDAVEEPDKSEAPADMVGPLEQKVVEPLPDIPKEIKENLRGPRTDIDYTAIKEMRKSIADCTSDYFHSAVLSKTKDTLTGNEHELVLRDWLLIGAFTNEDVLLTGGTGTGKTMLANRFAIALYGNDGYVEKTVTPGTREADFTDLRVSKMTEGATLAEAVEAPDVLKKPCVVINELNRMPLQIQNKLISFFDMSYEYLGAKFKVGHDYGNKRYQLRIVTINEGDRYRGTDQIDGAVRDRLIIEIPMDFFPLTKIDEMRKNTSEGKSLDEIVNNRTFITELTDITSKVKKVPLTEEAERFMEYLTGLDNCVRSNTGSKKGVDLRYIMEHACTGCHSIQRDNHICNSIYAPSPRAMSKVKKVAQAISVLRSYDLFRSKEENKRLTRQEEDLIRQPVVTTQDIITAAPFVFYSKMNINPMWIQKHYQGNKWAAVNSTIKIAYNRFVRFLDEAGDVADRYFDNPTVNDLDKTTLREYATTKDPWAYKLSSSEVSAANTARQQAGIDTDHTRRR